MGCGSHHPKLIPALLVHRKGGNGGGYPRLIGQKKRRFLMNRNYFTAAVTSVSSKPLHSSTLVSCELLLCCWVWPGWFPIAASSDGFGLLLLFSQIRDQGACTQVCCLLASADLLQIPKTEQFCFLRFVCLEKGERDNSILGCIKEKCVQ